MEKQSWEGAFQLQLLSNEEGVLLSQQATGCGSHTCEEMLTKQQPQVHQPPADPFWQQMTNLSLSSPSRSMSKGRSPGYHFPKIWTTMHSLCFTHIIGKIMIAKGKFRSKITSLSCYMTGGGYFSIVVGSLSQTGNPLLQNHKRHHHFLMHDRRS